MSHFTDLKTASKVQKALKERYTRPSDSGTQFKHSGPFEIPRPFGGDIPANDSDFEKPIEFARVKGPKLSSPRDVVSGPEIMTLGSRAHDMTEHEMVVPKKHFGRVDRIRTEPPSGNASDGRPEGKVRGRQSDKSSRST